MIRRSDPDSFKKENQCLHSFPTRRSSDLVLPIEIEIPFLRVLREVKLEEAEWVQARYEQIGRAHV